MHKHSRTTSLDTTISLEVAQASDMDVASRKQWHLMHPVGLRHVLAHSNHVHGSSVTLRIIIDLAQIITAEYSTYPSSIGSLSLHGRILIYKPVKHSIYLYSSLYSIKSQLPHAPSRRWLPLAHASRSAFSQHLLNRPLLDLLFFLYIFCIFVCRSVTQVSDLPP